MVSRRLPPAGVAGGSLRSTPATPSTKLPGKLVTHSTSSQPPSSDIVKPKKPLPKGGKKRSRVGRAVRPSVDGPGRLHQGPDEQFGGTGDSLRGDRPAHQARDAQRERPSVVREYLDGDRHLCPAGSGGLPVVARLGASPSPRYSTARAVAVRPLTASHAPCFPVVLRGHPRPPRERSHAAEASTFTRCGRRLGRCCREPGCRCGRRRPPCGRATRC